MEFAKIALNTFFLNMQALNTTIEKLDSKIHSQKLAIPPLARQTQINF